MTKAFKVAGHTFSLTLSDSSSLWPRLTQYDDFEVPVPEDVIFNLRLDQSLETPADAQIAYDAPTEPGETVIRLYKYQEGWYMEMMPDASLPVCGKLFCGPGFTDARLHICSLRMSDAIFCVNNSLMLLYAFTTASKNTLEMHASVIRHDGRGYLFLAKSGTGKSTHSQLWLDHIPGSDLLNDDNPIVRYWPEDGSVIVYGSPWSGKTPCYRNIECPVGAFVRIRRCAENRITPLSVFESYALLYSSCSGFKADEKMADALHVTLEGCVVNAPSFVLDCRPDEEAAHVCYGGVK